MSEAADLPRTLIIILVLTLANGFFAGSEMAIVSARRSRLEAKAAAGRRAARQAILLAENPDHFLAIVQVGITLIGTFSAVFGGARIAHVLALWLHQRWPAALSEAAAETLSLAMVVALLTYLSLVVGELVPKQLGLRQAERWALVAAPIMSAIAVATRPVVSMLTWSVNLVLRLLGQQGGNDQALTQADIEHLIREGQESGAVEEGEADIIKRVFQFADRPVRTVMTPRTQVVAVELGLPLAEIARTFLDSGYSRLPVFKGSVDNVVGILNAKDLLRQLLPEQTVELRDLLRPAVYLVDSDHTDNVLAAFRKSRTHMAVVIDEYGQTAGLVTLEDLLEELVGEIQDEYDQPEERSIIERDDGSWLVDGMEAYDRVCQSLGLP
ncbi:MAG TPA: hemolysin family protein, partial [Anaerolineae bacterium]|nr:hemolysin family protein [Anaerolineae bacterium]